MKKYKFDELEIEILSLLVDHEIEELEQGKAMLQSAQYEFDLRNLKHKLDLMMIDRANNRRG